MLKPRFLLKQLLKFDSPHRLNDAKLWVTGCCDRITLILTPRARLRKQNCRIQSAPSSALTHRPLREAFRIPPRIRTAPPVSYCRVAVSFLPTGTKANVRLFLIYRLIDWRNHRGRSVGHGPGGPPSHDTSKTSPEGLCPTASSIAPSPPLKYSSPSVSTACAPSASARLLKSFPSLSTRTSAPQLGQNPAPRPRPRAERHISPSPCGASSNPEGNPAPPDQRQIL